MLRETGSSQEDANNAGRPASGTLNLRAAVSAYVVFGFIFGFLTLAIAPSAFARGAHREEKLIFLALLGAWVLSYIWLFSFRLVVSHETLRYTTLFGQTRVRRLQEIKRITRESGINEYSDRFKPFIRLVVVSSKPDVATLNVNLKIFKLAEIRQLLECLRERYRSMGLPEVVSRL